MENMAHDASSPASPKPVDIAAQQASRPDTPDKGKLRVFISYSRDDLYFANQLDTALDAWGFECVIDRQGISGGEDWKRRLGDLISEADTVVFVLSPASASSAICAWEVEEAARLGKRILPVNCRPLEGASPPSRLRDLNYVFFYAEPKVSDSGFGTGLASLIAALNTDFDWLREHTRYLQRAIEWDRAGKPTNRLLSGDGIAEAKAWMARRPKSAPEPTPLHLDFIRTSENEAQKFRLKAERDEKRLKDAELQAALQSAEAAKDREAAAKKITRRTLVGTGSVVAVGGVAGYFAYNSLQAAEQSRNARAALSNQLTDLRNFWTQTRGHDSPTITGGPEETKTAPAIPGSNEGQPTWNINAVRADASPYTGKGCVVGLVGTGIEVSHPAFREVTFIQKDFTGTGNQDENGHTTHTAGTILGRPVDNKRFGVAPGVTEVLSAKVLDRNGSGTREVILAGLQWIADHQRRVDVICVAMAIDFAKEMSAHAQAAQRNRGQDLTQTIAKDLREYLQLLRAYQSLSAVAASLGKGAVLVMPAGNDSQENGRVPVTSPLSVAQGVISVGAARQGDNGYQVAWFSNSLPTVCAPGYDILSAFTGGKLRSLNGTSMSCAHAAGVAALWWECLRNRNPGGEVTSRMVAAEMLKTSRTDVFARDTQEIERGAGLLQAPPLGPPPGKR
jgi:hypothetical protein